MNKIFEAIDAAPGLHLFAISITLFLVARSMRRDVTFIASWQDVCGLATFMFLLVGRLFIAPPFAHEPDMVIGILFQGFAFGLIAFALAGVAGMAFVLTGQLFSRLGGFLRSAGKAERGEKQASSVLTEHQSELDRKRKEELLLQTQLAMEFELDKNRRAELQKLLEVYADFSLPLEDFRSRMEQFRNAITTYTPPKSRHYQSLQEIVDDFDQQIEGLDSASSTEFEKESLRALIMLERQNAIQRFVQK